MQILRHFRCCADQDETFCIEGNVGVRQGCVAAPFLWVAYVRFWLKWLAGILGWDWVRKHVTVYADDNHLAWEFTEDTQVHQSIFELGVVLRSFSEFGMCVNLDKTVAIFSLRGRSSTSLRKRYIQRGRKPLLKVDEHHLLPLVNQHRYLGVVVSYGQYTRQTLRHRKTCAMGAYMMLRRWWSSNLPLWRRILLWKACIWPSIVYGLVETGLTPTACLDFRVIILGQLRRIARSPCHITHESNYALLTRLNLDDPLLMLAKQVVTHWSNKLRQRGSLVPDDVLNDRWIPFQVDSHVLGWLQFCFHLLILWNLPWSHEASKYLWRLLSESGLDNMLRAYKSVIAIYSGESRVVLSEVSFTCELCGQMYSSLRGLRVHQHKIHQTVAYEPVIEATERQEGIDGMPICNRCGVRFSTWYAFDRHYSKGVCQSEVASTTFTSLSSSKALMSTSRTQDEHRQYHSAPVLQRHELVKAIRDDWALAPH